MATRIHGGLLSAVLASALCGACCDCERDRVEAAVPAAAPPDQTCLSTPVPGKDAGETLYRIDCANAELPDLVRAMAKVTKKNFLFDDRVKGRVTIRSEQPVTPEEAYGVFRAALKVKGFVIEDAGEGLLEILPRPSKPSSP